MSRSNEDRLHDILGAIERIEQIWLSQVDRVTVVEACLFPRVVSTRLGPLREAVQRLLDRA